VTEEAAWEQVDWTEVERRERAREPWFVLVLAAVAVGWGGLSDRVFFASGTAKWVVLAGYVLLFVVMLVAQRINPRLRGRARDGYRLQYALREHVDPGPELREKADRQAGYMTRIVWFRWWLLFLIPAGVLAAAPWGDRPLVVVPSALVLVAGVVVWALCLRCMDAAARRWVADPPGPPREMPTPRRWERWVFGWRIVWVFLVVLAVTIGVAVFVVVTR
jgi:hypothetical protein